MLAIPQIVWHDFAFYDPHMYESLRQMIINARSPDGQANLSELQLTFQVQLREEESGGIHVLCTNGGSKPVLPENVYEYVERYALLRMINWCQPVLEVSVTPYVPTFIIII